MQTSGNKISIIQQLWIISFYAYNRQMSHFDLMSDKSCQILAQTEG